MNPRCMRCEKTAPRVPGLCICEECVDRAGTEQVARWLKNNLFRQWHQTRRPVKQVRSRLDHRLDSGTPYNPGKPPVLVSIVRSVLQESDKPLHIFEVIDRVARKDPGRIRKCRTQFQRALCYLKQRQEVISRRVKLDGFSRIQTVYFYQEISE